MSSRRRRRHRHRTTSDAHAAPDPTAVGEDADLAAGPPESRAEAPGLPARVEATIVPARDLVTEIVTEEDTGHAALRPEVVDRCINETYAKEGIRVIQPTVPQEGGGPVSPIPVGDDKCLVTLFVPANEATFSVPGREGDTPVCRGVIIQVNGEDVVEGLLTGTGYGVPVSAWVGFLPGDDSAV